ncbi:serine/threonine-protein kinase [Nonomuraea ferruginea]
MTRHEPGDILARRYLLLDPLARGGMSVIWRAFDQSLHRMVAVKVQCSSLQTGLGDRVRARSEARAAARFIHPDAIEIYDYGEAVTTSGEVAAFVVMPLLDGVPLAERLERGPLPWAEAAAVAMRTARVLAAGHARGLVHRDVTAENVLLTGDGLKLLDFGIAAWAGDPDDERGTPPYVAPERLAGAPTHPAVDVYALGVLLFTMIEGRTPYPETTWEQLETARRPYPPPRPPGAPHAIALLCQRCLDPELAPPPGGGGGRGGADGRAQPAQAAAARPGRGGSGGARAVAGGADGAAPGRDAARGDGVAAGLARGVAAVHVDAVRFDAVDGALPGRGADGPAGGRRLPRHAGGLRRVRRARR